MERELSWWQYYSDHLVQQSYLQEQLDIEDSIRGYCHRNSSGNIDTTITETTKAADNVTQNVNQDEIEKARGELRAMLNRFGLVELIVKGDGNCQFRAVSDQIYGHEKFHDDVRQIAVTQLSHYPELYQGYVEGDFKEYCSKMSKAGTWGDHVTLKALSDFYGLTVSVLTSHIGAQYIRISPQVQQSNRELWLSFWSEVHYNSLYPEVEGLTMNKLKQSKVHHSLPKWLERIQDEIVQMIYPFQ